jgi:hypothetical protein
MSVIVNPLAAAAISFLSVISGASGQAVGPGDTGTVGPEGGGAHDPVDPPLRSLVAPNGSIAPEGGGAHDPVPRGLRPDADFSPAQCENLLSLWSSLPPDRQAVMRNIKANCEARLAAPDNVK